MKVSVVIAAYEGGDYLRRAVESVLAQTYTDYEIILVDDGEPSGSARRVADMHPAIRYHRQGNSERAVARNNGISLAHGQYVALLDQDDLWVPRKLEQQVAFLDAAPRSVGLVYSPGLVIDEEDRILAARYRKRYREGRVARFMLGGNFIRPSSVLVSRAALEKVGGFDPATVPADDWDFFFRIALDYELAFIREPLARFRHHAAQTSRQAGRMALAMEAVQQKIFARPDLPRDLVQRRRAAESEMHLEISEQLLSGGERAEAARHLRRSLAAAPQRFLSFRVLVLLARLIARRGHRRAPAARRRSQEMTLVLGSSGSLRVVRQSGLLDSRIKLYFQNYIRLFERIHVVTRDDPSFTAPELPERTSLCLHELTARHPRLAWYLFPVLFRDQIRRSRCVYCSHVNAGVSGLIAKVLYGKPFALVVSYEWSGSMKTAGHSFGRLWARFLESVLYNTSDVILAASPEIADGVKRRILVPRRRERVKLRTHFVQVERFTPKEDYGLSSPAKVLFVGRLADRIKRISLLVQALAGLPGVMLQVAGEGEDRAELERLAAETGVGAVFLGKVSQDDLSACYREADIFCLTSPREGVPKVLLEAMSTGLPCVGTRVPGIAWLLEHERGKLCEGTPESIRLAITDLLGDQALRERLGREARRYVSSFHSVERVMDQEREALEWMLARG